MSEMPFATQYSATPLRKLSACQTLSSTCTASMSTMCRASSICPTFTLHRPIWSMRPSRFSEASARTLDALGPVGGDVTILTELQVPDAPAGSRAVYMKEMVRETFDFALSSVAAMLTMKNGLVQDARIVLGGVAPVPYRALKAEEALRGKRLDEATAAAAGVAATDGARPMTRNAYKVPLTQAVVKRALLSIA